MQIGRLALEAQSRMVCGTGPPSKKFAHPLSRIIKIGGIVFTYKSCLSFGVESYLDLKHL